jgi:hypothetical protein
MRTQPALTARRRTSRRSLALWAALVAAAALATGCSASAGSSAASATAADMGGAPAHDSAGDKAPDASNEQLVADADRQVIVTGYVTVVVDDPIAKATRVATLVENHGGFVSGRTQQSGGSDRKASAELTARIPAAAVSDVIAKLADLGSVESTQLDSVEVTAQARDLDARIHALQISISRLEALLDRTAKLSDIVDAEQVLTDRQSQVEQLQSERAALADKVAMSTITISLFTDAAVPDEPPTGFVSGLTTGWKALVTFGRWLLGVVGVLLPWLIPVAIVVAIARPLVLRSRRRSAERAASRPATHPAQVPAMAGAPMAPWGPPPSGAVPPVPPAPPAPPASAEQAAPVEQPAPEPPDTTKE